MLSALRIEELEDRIAPTVIAAGDDPLEFTDADGDLIVVTYLGPAGSQVNVTNATGGNIGNGDTIGWMTITGSDYRSILRVENLGGGNGRTDILEGVRATTPNADVGVIALGVSQTGASTGTVLLGDGAQILSEGAIGSVIVAGNLDFNTASHLINAGGNIGLVEVRGNMTLDSDLGVALINAGVGEGQGDISFIHVTGNILNSDGSALATRDVGGGLTINDDVGLGNTGTITIRLSGTGATGTVTAIPVLGGGEVLSRLVVSGATGIAITTSGAGGDVTAIIAADDIGDVRISGAADTDVYLVTANGINSVTNSSVGGDLVGIEATTRIGTVQTQRLGVLGAAFTGQGNRTPLVTAGDLMLADRTSAGSDIARINVGGVFNTSISGTSLGQLSANPGGIGGVTIDIDGSSGAIVAAYISDSTVYAANGIASIRLGSAGVTDSTIATRGRLGSLQTSGSIVDSNIAAAFEEGNGSITGGSIGSIQAGSISGSLLASLGGFDSIRVKGAFVESAVQARFADIVLGANVGGGVGSFSAGSFANNSTMVALGNIGSVAIGAGGMVAGSFIDTSGTISRVNIRGDMADEAILNASGGLGNIVIGGDFAYDSRIGTLGNLDSLQISGQLVGSDIIVLGNVPRLSVRGGMHGVGITIGINGDVGTLDVAGGIHSAGGGTIVGINGDANRINISGGMNRTVIDVGGNLNSFNAASRGIMYLGGLSVGGNLGSARMQASNTYLNVGGNAGNVTIVSDAHTFSARVGGNLQSFNVGGTLTTSGNGVVVEGDVGTFSVRGDVNNSRLSFGTEASPSTVGNLNIGGGLGSTELSTWGDISRLTVRGSSVSSSMLVRGDLLDASIGRGLYGSIIAVHGGTQRFSVTNAVNDSQTVFIGGVNNYTVRGSIYNSIIGTTAYTEAGSPVGGGIGTLTAGDINGATINANGGIGTVTSRGVIHATTINTVSRANNGAGAIVGGGTIGTVSAKGMYNSDVASYGNIGSLSMGDEGIGVGSTVTTVNGNLGSISTRGLISGEISIAGNLTGNVSTGGGSVLLGPIPNFYHFTDANGSATGGTLRVAGQVTGNVN